MVKPKISVLKVPVETLLHLKVFFENLTLKNFKTFWRLLRSPNPGQVVEKIKTKYEISKEIGRASESRYPDCATAPILQLFMKRKLKLFLENTGLRFELPENDVPMMSVILVLFNRAEYTYQCLESIKANADVPYEVILVDNASSDDTPELLNRIENATIVRNAENIGFLKACNQGAEIARGKWLLFLNNDTQIMPSLFSCLLQTTEKITGCGAVGAKLIHSDGKLQEAGSIIWKDGSCSGYGRGDDPFKPEYSFLREVPYCSGACLFVKKEIFSEAGMFNERFAPAYYEETDLCMRIRELGYKVVYQPAAVLIHYEFGSSLSVGKALDLQGKNKQVFSDLWTDRLKSLYPYSPENVLFAREYHRHQKTKLLIIEDRVPDPGLGSGYPRSHGIVEYLSDLGYGVTVFPLQLPERLEPCTRLLQQKGVEVFYGHKYKKINFKNFFRERKNYYDAVWVSRPHNMKEVIDVIRELHPAQKVIYDAEALFSLRDIMMAELEGAKLSEREKNKMIREEIDLMKRADVVVNVSEYERAVLKKYQVDHVEVLGHSYHAHPTTTPFDRRKDILFLGSFLVSPSPNEDAVHYFINQIYPKVLQATGAKFFIVGTNYLDSIRKLKSDHIIVTGRVDSLYPYFDKCRVFAVPTRYAAGIPWKLQESLSFGLPAVVTPLIADQLGVSEEIVSIGENTDDFTDKMIHCYTDRNRWHALRQKGLEYIEKECSPTAYKKHLNDIIRGTTDRKMHST